MMGGPHERRSWTFPYRFDTYQHPENHGWAYCLLISSRSCFRRQSGWNLRHASCPGWYKLNTMVQRSLSYGSIRELGQPFNLCYQRCDALFDRMLSQRRRPAGMNVVHPLYLHLNQIRCSSLASLLSTDSPSKAIERGLQWGMHHSLTLKAKMKRTD
ncbi:hypothetical protein CY34DRAFT_715570 [Suillus luteus UH-Slu-Lm8-n1]|uniref:Uncharacterized protein n=1 Tax=Suillus luteus UH-Slu-Lm8-n1 TaxID=930992 RepID=A0A0C9ZVB9_9AGAM|nr:hypothetical protein CY34DRAFT_715570 [Suillus luteus UH-Slu-Lm8-n1]